jgi:hypothetical protein
MTSNTAGVEIQPVNLRPSFCGEVICCPEDFDTFLRPLARVTPASGPRSMGYEQQKSFEALSCASWPESMGCKQLL